MKAGSLLLALLAGAVGVAQADHDTSYHDGIKHPTGQQQLSKRPYVAPVEKTDTLEGAAITKEDKAEEAKNNVHKPLRLFFLDRRPYQAPKN